MYLYLKFRTTNRVLWVQQVIIKYILDMSALVLAYPVLLVRGSTLDLATFRPAVPAQLVRQGSGLPLALGSNLARPWQDLGHLRATLLILPNKLPAPQDMGIRYQVADT